MKKPKNPKYRYFLTTHQFFKGDGTCGVKGCQKQADIIWLPLKTKDKQVALCNQHFEDGSYQMGWEGTYIEIEEACSNCGKPSQVIFAIQHGLEVSFWNSCLKCQKKELRGFLKDFSKRISDVEDEMKSNKPSKSRQSEVK